MRLTAELCPEAIRLQELGNELIARPNFDNAVLGQWRQGPMLGFSDTAKPPTTILTAPFPWLPEGDAERLVEVSGLEYPIFYITSAVTLESQTPALVTVALGGTAFRSLFEDQGRCAVSTSTQGSGGSWSTAHRHQDGMNSEAGFGYGPTDVLGLLEQIRQAAQ